MTSAMGRGCWGFQTYGAYIMCIYRDTDTSDRVIEMFMLDIESTLNIVELNSRNVCRYSVVETATGKTLMREAYLIVKLSRRRASRTSGGSSTIEERDD